MKRRDTHLSIRGENHSFPQNTIQYRDKYNKHFIIFDWGNSLLTSMSNTIEIGDI